MRSSEPEYLLVQEFHKDFELDGLLAEVAGRPYQFLKFVQR